jgi:hypothetical protein
MIKNIDIDLIIMEYINVYKDTLLLPFQINRFYFLYKLIIT